MPDAAFTEYAIESTPPNSQARWDIVLPHRERLLRLARRRLASDHDAEDCVHDTLIRCVLFSGLDERRVGEFLTSTLIRLCIDVRRRETRTTRMRIRECPMPVDSVEEVVCRHSSARWLAQATDGLQGREREIMLARAGGLSTVQAAAALGISPKTAEGAFTRARARLLTLSMTAI